MTKYTSETITSFDRNEFKPLLQALECIPDSFCAASKLSEDKIIYVSKSIEIILGYPQEKIIKEGTPFFYRITSPEYLPEILRRSAHYLKQAETTPRHLRKPVVFQFDSGLRHANGKIVSINQWGVFTGYTPSGSIDSVISCNYVIDDKIPSVIAETKERVEEIFSRINVLYEGESELTANTPQTLNSDLQQNYYPLQPVVRLTRREKEILQLVANGFATKEIAAKLGMSFNTAETHRKNLLEKFEAKNSVELVKKASKVFWFE